MSLKIREMLIGHPTRLRYVVRFSTCHKVHPENVAEHSYYVALYAMLIADWCDAIPGQSVPMIDHYTLMRKAILHDLEEAITGDVNRIFKYSLPEVKEALDCGAEYAFATLTCALTDDESAASDYQDTWKRCKDDSVEGRIIKFCDYLAVLSYMTQELTNANITMREHWTTMHDYAAEFHKPCYELLRPLVEQADALLHEAFARGRG